ncbi:FeoB-associated Cys-rich membrane protein [Pedobacter sp. MC2016-14]|uniref:FeoB-associated Cys-rich membrane protein n=1 Tax=Pedobacter sp. MC2016-14 TaxID=2897327 RepID=UPI00351D69C7
MQTSTGIALIIFVIMDIQTVLVIILFVAALFYIGRMLYRSLVVKSGNCGSNCKCGVDFSDVKPENK